MFSHSVDVFHFFDSTFQSTKVYHFYKVKLYFFFFFVCSVVSKKPLTYPWSCRFVNVFSQGLYIFKTYIWKCDQLCVNLCMGYSFSGSF